MQIDTPTIRRLRDRLLADPTRATASPPLHPHKGLTANQQAALDRVAPLAEVLFLTMAADGDLTRSETLAVRRAIAALTDDLLPSSALDHLLAHLEVLLASQGRDSRLEAVASRFCLHKPDAEAAFNLAAAVALSDGEVAASEHALIDELRQYFGIPPQRAAALLGGAPTLR